MWPWIWNPCRADREGYEFWLYTQHSWKLLRKLEVCFWSVLSSVENDQLFAMHWSAEEGVALALVAGSIHSSNGRGPTDQLAIFMQTWYMIYLNHLNVLDTKQQLHCISFYNGLHNPMETVILQRKVSFAVSYLRRCHRLETMNCK